MNRIALLALLFFSIWSPAAGQDLAELAGITGMADSSIEQRFGKPDEVVFLDEKEAYIWTYFISPGEGFTGDKADDSLSEGMAALCLAPTDKRPAGHGYRQFAFWNGRAAAFCSYRQGLAADSLYHTTLDYLEENARWLGRGTGSAFNRLTRMGDNVWIIDREGEGALTQAVVHVGDAGYSMCSKANLSELRRVKAQFGVNIEQH